MDIAEFGDVDDAVEVAAMHSPICGNGFVHALMATVIAVAVFSSAMPARAEKPALAESGSVKPDGVEPMGVEPDETGSDAADTIRIIVGVRADAKPFSYRKEASVVGGDSILEGYGGYSIEICREVLREMASADGPSAFEVETREIAARNRFEMLDKGFVDMLCGPDSITPGGLSKFQVSFPVFLAGMSYAYVDPASALFPKSRYCDNIIGVVNGTTAETAGLADLARSDLLMRFDEALDRELALDARRLEKVGRMLREEIVDATSPEEASRAGVWEKIFGIESWKRMLRVRAREKIFSVESQVEIFGVEPREELLGSLSWEEMRGARSWDEMFRVESREETLGSALRVEKGWPSPFESNESIQRTIDRDGDGKLRDAISRRHGKINSQMAQLISTDECPAGFVGLPVRQYLTHEDGIADFCAGDVLYYLGDYDIIKSKIEEISRCDVVLNRFTRSREVYGVFFRKPGHAGRCRQACTGEGEGSVRTAEATCRSRDMSGVDGRAAGLAGECSELTSDESARLFTRFNNTLVGLMQGDTSRVEEIFASEFGEGRMSDDLEEFFASLKIFAPSSESDE